MKSKIIPLLMYREDVYVHIDAVAQYSCIVYHTDHRIMPRKHSQSNKARKRAGPDLDELVNDMQHDTKLARLIDQPVDLDEPGRAQYYCMPCALV
jgi:hypothetical protein